jgi:ELWxxDGT repeat protein
VIDLWTSNGTTTGTVLLKESSQRPSIADPPIYTMAGAGSTLYFALRELNDDSELWKSDGTPAGTTLVKRVLPGEGWFGWLTSLADFEGTLYFGTIGYTHTDLWRSDGSEAGTVVVKDLIIGDQADGWLGSLSVVGQDLYFSTNDGTAGFEPW